MHENWRPKDDAKPDIKLEQAEKKDTGLFKSTFSLDDDKPEMEVDQKPFLSSLAVNSAPKVEVDAAPKIEMMDIKEEKDSPADDFISDDEDHPGGSRDRKKKGAEDKQPSPQQQPAPVKKSELFCIK